MQYLLWPSLCLAIAGCGPPATTLTAPAKVEAVITIADDLRAEDLGAVVVGATITVPAFHEIQMAAVVFRDGAFSPADSFIHSRLSNQEQRQTCRLVAFSPHGPLRSEATDALVMVNGRMLRWTGNAGASMYGHEGPPVLSPAAPFVRIASLVYGGTAPGGYSSDVRNPANVAFAVHLFARLVALAPDDTRLTQLHAVSHPHNTSRDLPIKTLDDIIGDGQTAIQQGPSSF